MQYMNSTNIEDYFNFVEQQKVIIQNELQGQQIANEGVVNLIIAALCNTDSQIRQNAETSLMLMRQTDVVLHTEDVLKAIAVSFSQETLQYVIPYTLSLTKSLKQLKVFQEDQVLLKILSYFFVALSNRNLNQKQTKILVSCLPYLLDLSCSAQQPDWFLLTTLKECEKLFEQSGHKRDIYLGLSIIHALIMDVFTNEKVRDVLVNLLQKMFMILETMTNFAFQEVISDSRDLQNLEGNFQILEMTCQILTISIQRVQNAKSELMQIFLSNLHLMNFFEMVIQFNFNQALKLQNSDPNISLITFDQSQTANNLMSLFKLINGIKFNSLKSLVVMNQYYLQKEQQTKQQMFDTVQIQQNYSYFLQKFESILLHICKQLHLCVNNQSPQFLSHIYCQQSCIKNIDFAVVFIINSVNDSKLYKFFAQNYQDIFNEILLSLICNNIKDYESYSEESDEFIKLEQDLYNNRESDILKSNGCELIFRLAEQIDGFLAYAIQFCCKMIDLIFKEQSDNQFKESLLKYQSSLFLTLDKANQIETILLLLILLSRQAGQRRDLIKQIEVMLNNYFTSDLIKVSGISRLRCSALISYYSIYLFTDFDKHSNIYVAINTKLLSDMMVFLIKYLKNKQEEKGVSVAIDTLFRLIITWELKGCIESIITDIIETLVELINDSQNGIFFEFLEKVIDNYTFIIKNYATEIIKNLCNRINKIQNQIKGKKYESSMLIMQCISCIVSFIRDEKIFNDFYIYFEENILELIKYFDIVDQIQFEDKLCDLSVCILQQLREFEELNEVIGRNLEKLYQKNSCSIRCESFYELLVEVFRSEYLLYDKQYILCNVFRIAIDSIKQLNINQLTYQYPEFIQACFLIQLGIQHNHEIFNSKQKLYEDIMIYLIQLYPSLTSQQFYPLKCIQIFLFFFYYQPVQTLNAIKNSNILIHLLQQLEQKYIADHLEQPYDRKVLSYGLIGLINNWQQCSLNHQDVSKLFKLALYTLNYTSTSSSVKTEQFKVINEYKHKGSIEKSAKVSRPQFNDDDTWLQSNEEPLDLYDINVSDIEYERLNNFYYKPERDFYPKIEKYNPPAYKCDEYSMYRQMLKNLKKSQVELFNFIIQSLNEEENKLYNSIVKAQIVQTSNNSYSVRQIKKIKKKNQFYEQINHIVEMAQEDILQNTDHSQTIQQNKTNQIINDKIIDEDI
ncbi:hypothetical protein ABPG72_013282 [Tetrahymena utriculariae]